MPVLVFESFINTDPSALLQPLPEQLLLARAPAFNGPLDPDPGPLESLALNARVLGGSAAAREVQPVQPLAAARLERHGVRHDSTAPQGHRGRAQSQAEVALDRLGSHRRCHRRGLSHQDTRRTSCH